MTTPVDYTTMTEDEAINLFHKMAYHFGWAGTFFTREDAEWKWDTEADGPFTDEVWEMIRAERSWRKGMEEMMCEWGWDIVADTVGDVARRRQAASTV